MELTVLVDNNTLIDRYFYGEPGVSYFIEDEGERILFDVGYSDVFIKNAQKMNIDLLNVGFLVLSHFPEFGVRYDGARSPRHTSWPVG